MPTPSAPMAGLTAANANPTVGTVAAIGARTTSAISAVNGAAKGNQGAETAWGWYHADSTKCAKEGDVCKHTPSAVSDALAKEFETSLYYGHSVARVKVQQALSILQSDLATPSATRDIVAHMLIPRSPRPRPLLARAYRHVLSTIRAAACQVKRRWRTPIPCTSIGTCSVSRRRLPSQEAEAHATVSDECEDQCCSDDVERLRGLFPRFN